MLVMAAEDYSGTGAQDPSTPATASPPTRRTTRTRSKANGIGYDVYDVDARGRTAPDPLGVLSHYKAVIWYTGNDAARPRAGALGQTGTSRLAHDEIVNVRDYLNEGGKLLYTGKNAADAQLVGYNYNPAGQPPYCTTNTDVPPEDRIPNERCAVLNDDFLQYWLGAYLHIDAAQTTRTAASALGFKNVGDPFGATEFKLNGPDSAGNQDHVYSMVTTSSILTPDEFPQFKSERGDQLPAAAAPSTRRPATTTCTPSPTTRAGSGCARRST